MKTLLTLAILGGVGFWLLNKTSATAASTAGTSATSLTVVPLPAGSVQVFTASGNTIYRDASGNYYAQQGASSYVLPLTKTNAEHLLLGYLTTGG